MEKKILCFDFDNTLVIGHFHNLSVNAGYAPISEIHKIIVKKDDKRFDQAGEELKATEPSDDFLEGLLDNPDTGLKNGKGIVDIMVKAIDEGHKVAIVSFSSYPKAIVYTLRKMFEEYKPEKVDFYTQQIFIVAGFPSDFDFSKGTKKGKEEHIEAAIKHFSDKSNTFERANCVLIDDSEDNINTADNTIEAWTVLVPKKDWENSYYLDKIIIAMNHDKPFGIDPFSVPEEVGYNDQYYEKLYKPYMDSLNEDSDSDQRAEFDKRFNKFMSELKDWYQDLRDEFLSILKDKGESFSIEDVRKIDALRTYANRAMEIDEDTDWIEDIAPPVIETKQETLDPEKKTQNETIKTDTPVIQPQNLNLNDAFIVNYGRKSPDVMNDKKRKLEEAEGDAQKEQKPKLE